MVLTAASILPTLQAMQQATSAWELGGPHRELAALGERLEGMQQHRSAELLLVDIELMARAPEFASVWRGVRPAAVPPPNRSAPAPPLRRSSRGASLLIRARA